MLRAEGPAFNSHIREGVDAQPQALLRPEGPAQLVSRFRRSSRPIYPALTDGLLADPSHPRKRNQYLSLRPIVNLSFPDGKPHHGARTLSG
jgi:hypothetical protein